MCCRGWLLFRAAMGTVVGLAAVGCAGEAERSTVTVRDSAGIRIVENSGVEEIRAPWTVPSEPVFRVGWGERDPLLENVSSGVLLDDGRVAIGDSGSGLIRILSAGGAVLSTFGGRGEGPGEFTGLSSVVPGRGDTLLAQDLNGGRVSAFVDSTLVWDEAFMPWVGNGAFRVLGRVGDGYALWPSAFRVLGRGFTGWQRFPLLLADARFTALDTLAMVGLVRWDGPDDHNPIGPSGAVTIAAGLAVYGTSDRPELTWVEADGAVRQIARWDEATREPREDDWEAYAARYRAEAADRYPAVELEQQLALQHDDYAGPLPHFRRAFGDREGNVWLTPYDPATPNARAQRLFSIVSADGRCLGRVAFPREIRPLDITGDRFLGVEQDDFDVQAVVLYRIEKPGG